ncbi:MAG: matrixin family metalloprotease [Candidatus Scalindua rubra]|uniref:Metalloproteinase n=1 Tax=Candidatus Scalindua brodae TaxID=237368 RepID=A0A0B0EQJ8_9BACT|nr:MAG: metalloproteinase [Candidatus Scalindua brodae]MBZ0108118.1 matrixin family metalloprotease [Candidatus Scalindua rubra]TWU31263.1 Serralysin C precursor [Candidatus Brocadiaceae bacterium S225]
MAKQMKKKNFCFSGKQLNPDIASTDDVYKLQSLLGRYGYLRGAYYPGSYDEATRNAVSQFQSFYHIYPEDDGVCDQQTIDLLNTPRCSMSDPSPGQRSVIGRLAPYVTVGAKWQMNSLSYRYLNSTPDLPEDRQREIIKESFNRWSEISALEFIETQKNLESDISIAFHRGSHGDGEPFDDSGGPDGNTLAHAFFPPPAGGSWAGSLHFDEYETWKDQPGGMGIRLYNVSLHEIGHLLGLSHSQDQNAIMYAYYAEDRNDLRADDIAGIQSLYGSAAPGPVAISPGQMVSGYLQQKNDKVQYQVTLQNKLLVKLDGPSGQDFDLYVRYGKQVDKKNEQYDSVGYGVTADELVTIEGPKAGTYYILVDSYRGSGSYNLEVEVV